ncbi:DUF4390 domain-containing protein [Magnetococcales bacterium HHB-1]
MATLVIGATALFLIACTANIPDDEASPIHHVKLTMQGDQVYAHVTLKRKFINQLLTHLTQGETFNLHYHYILARSRPWLPKQILARKNIKKHLRYHLITRRFQLQDLHSEQKSYTTELEEAYTFINPPAYLPLLGKEKFSAGEYHLTLRFNAEQAGASHIFRKLYHWFTFWEPVEYEKTASYERLDIAIKSKASQTNTPVQQP